MTSHLGQTICYFITFGILGVRAVKKRKAETGGMADGLRDLCELAGIPYLSPHKLRHGHAVYVMRRVKDLKQLKSLSQNLMHSSVMITDRIYTGILLYNIINNIYFI